MSDDRPAAPEPPEQQHADSAQARGSPPADPRTIGPEPPDFPRPPPPPGAVDDQRQGGAPGRDPVPVIAFVFSFFGGVLVAIPLAVWGLVRTKAGQRRGRGFAVAALCISAAWVVVSVVAVLNYGLLRNGGQTPVADISKGPPASSATAPSATSPPTSTSARTPLNPQPTGPLAKPRRVIWIALKPTMCVQDPGTPGAYVTVVDCRADHQAEVTARTVLPGTKWPGDAAVQSAAEAKCKPPFEKYVGVPFDSSRLDLNFLTADATGWRQGDHTLICFVYDPDDGHLTRALRGAAE
jgi:hypothetical protein